MSLQLTYPIADLRGIKLHLERNFYGVQTTDHYNITNIEYVKVSEHFLCLFLAYWSV